jgi:hypothetical protein
VHYLLILADMLWLRMAQGYQTNVCPRCGFNSALSSNAPGDFGKGRTLRTTDYHEKINASFYAAEKDFLSHCPDIAESFYKSKAFTDWKEENPGHVGPSLFPFLSSFFFHSDRLHCGLSLVPKETVGTVVWYAMKLESEGKHGILRLLSSLRRASLGLCALRIEFALKEAGAFNKEAREASNKGGRTKELVESYVKPLLAPRLRVECNDLGIPTKDGKNNKDRRTLAFDLVTELVKRVADGSITPAHLLSGDRLTVEGSLQELADASLAAGEWGVTAPQLMAIISGRMKMIGRECTTLLITYPQLITGMSVEFDVVQGAITEALARVDANLLKSGNEISEVEEQLAEAVVG